MVSPGGPGVFCVTICHYRNSGHGPIPNIILISSWLRFQHKTDIGMRWDEIAITLRRLKPAASHCSRTVWFFIGSRIDCLFPLIYQVSISRGKPRIIMHHQCSIDIKSSFHASSHSISTCQGGITVSPKIRWAGTRNLGSPGWIGGGIQRSLSGRGRNRLSLNHANTIWYTIVSKSNCLLQILFHSCPLASECHHNYYCIYGIQVNIILILWFNRFCVQRRRVAGSFWIWSGRRSLRRLRRRLRRWHHRQRRWRRWQRCLLRRRRRRASQGPSSGWRVNRSNPWCLLGMTGGIALNTHQISWDIVISLILKIL